MGVLPVCGGSLYMSHAGVHTLSDQTRFAFLLLLIITLSTGEPGRPAGGWLQISAECPQKLAELPAWTRGQTGGRREPGTGGERGAQGAPHWGRSIGDQ